MKKIIYLLFAVIFFSLAACKKDDATEPHYTMELLEDVIIEQPNRVNLFFQITNRNNVGISGKQASDFIVKENGKQVGSESQVSIKPEGTVDVLVKTILLIDNSISLEADLSKIKEAAIALINQKPEYQKIAIYTFSSNPQLVQEMTANRAALITAINAIQIGTSSTNLYGALVETGNADIWTEHYSIDSIRCGNLICLTDGDDTQGSVTKQAALNALSNKKVYMLGLGNEMDENIMKEFGTFLRAENISKLEDVFMQIQTDIDNTANSFYWLYYQSPKRGDNDHILRVEIDGNVNGSSNSYIEVTFNSRDFTDK